MSTTRKVLFASAVACLVAACGGGGDGPAAPVTLVAEAPATQATHVRVEGCALDATNRPLALPVHALAADGRLIASALTDNDGVFRLQVPARDHVTLAAATPGAEPLKVLTGSVDLTVAACLRPSLA